MSTKACVVVLTQFGELETAAKVDGAEVYLIKTEEILHASLYANGAKQVIRKANLIGAAQRGKYKKIPRNTLKSGNRQNHRSDRDGI